MEENKTITIGDNMTKEQLDEVILKGVKDLKEGKTIPFDEASFLLEKELKK